MKFDVTSTQSDLINAIRQEGRIWVVGGAVRDVLLGKVPKDLDFCTDLTPSTTESIAVRRGYTVIPDQTAKNHGIIRVVDKTTGELIDIATLRKDRFCDGRHAEVEFTTDLRADLARRDFTINAIAAHVTPDGEIDGTIFDHHCGRVDLHAQRIEFVGLATQRIQEDALRMIRACRFTALGENWHIPNMVIHNIQEHRELITNVSKERIRDEVLKALSYSKPSNFFRNLHACGLLEFVMPDLAKGVGVEQNKHHAEDVFEHLMRCLDASVELTNNVMLRLAALTHDIAKPHTKSTDLQGNTHFFKHEIEGASLIYNWMREYKFTKSDCQYVSKMVRYHQWRFEKNSKDKTIRKWLQDVGRDHWRDLITLRCADRRGNLKKQNKPMMTSHMHDLIHRAENIINSHEALFKEDLVINGSDIQNLGVKPGKVYSEIFANLLGIVINDPNKNNKEWLTEYVKRNYVKNE